MCRLAARVARILTGNPTGWFRVELSGARWTLASGNVAKLDTGDNRATLKSRSERGRPDLSDLRMGLRA